jgi:hypothetical protein
MSRCVDVSSYISDHQETDQPTRPTHPHQDQKGLTTTQEEGLEILIADLGMLKEEDRASFENIQHFHTEDNAVVGALDSFDVGLCLLWGEKK